MGISRLVISASVLSLALAACSEPGSTPVEPRFSSKAVTPIRCPINVTHSTSSVIGPLGGALSLDGTVVTIPVNAVLTPTTFTLTIPASNNMEVDVSAAGVEHFVFEKPVTMSIDYSRCNRSSINQSPLSIWYFDTNTGELLENMGGIDDKLTRHVTFVTPHFSGYVIAD